MMNPFQIMTQLFSSKNPQQAFQSMFGNNPLYQRAMQMAQGKSPEQIQQIAKNLCNNMGIDYDSAYKQFQQMMSKQ